MKPKNNCPICQKFRKLGNHLFELSEFCRTLDNSVEYIKGETSRAVKTSVIADWLKLAAELETVEINSWKFGDHNAAMFCEPIAAEYSSNARHYTIYSTAITRFIFISHALEEMYRFVDPEYLKSVKDSKQVHRDPSLRAAYLIDTFDEESFPGEFKHAVSNLIFTFKKYELALRPLMTGMKYTNEQSFSYGLHLIRNLRNHISHGVFPIIDNPDYWGEGELSRNELVALLFHASRVTALYIQSLIYKFNKGFHSDLYFASISFEEESEYFSKNCVTDLAKSLHLDEGFSFEDIIGIYDDAN